MKTDRMQVMSNSFLVKHVENELTLGEAANTLPGIWGEYVAEGF